MLHTRLWIIILSTALLATPAVAAGDQADTGDDCFAVAAPMAMPPGNGFCKPGTRPRERRKDHSALVGGTTLRIHVAPSTDCGLAYTAHGPMLGSLRLAKPCQTGFGGQKSMANRLSTTPLTAAMSGRRLTSPTS